MAQDAKTRLEAEVADVAEKRDLILQVCADGQIWHFPKPCIMQSHTTYLQRSDGHRKEALYHCLALIQSFVSILWRELWFIQGSFSLHAGRVCRLS